MHQKPRSTAHCTADQVRQSPRALGLNSTIRIRGSKMELECHTIDVATASSSNSSMTQVQEDCGFPPTRSPSQQVPDSHTRAKTIPAVAPAPTQSGPMPAGSTLHDPMQPRYLHSSDVKPAHQQHRCRCLGAAQVRTAGWLVSSLLRLNRGKVERDVAFRLASMQVERSKKSLPVVGK